MYSGIRSGNILAYILTFDLCGSLSGVQSVYIPTFYMKYILTFYLAFYLTYILVLDLAYILACILALDLATFWPIF